MTPLGRGIARPRPILPHGLYTEMNVAAPSIRTLAAGAAISTSRALPRSGAVSPAAPEVAAIACWTFGPTISMPLRMVTTASPSLTTIQTCWNSPHFVPSDSTTPVTIARTAIGWTTPRVKIPIER